MGFNSEPPAFVVANGSRADSHCDEAPFEGYNFDWLVKHVAILLNIEPKDVLALRTTFGKSDRVGS